MWQFSLLSKSSLLIFVLLFNSKPILSDHDCYRRIHDCYGNDVCYSSSWSLEKINLSDYEPCRALVLCSYYCSKASSCKSYDFRTDTGVCRLHNSVSDSFYANPSCSLYVRADTVTKFTIYSFYLFSVYVNGVLKATFIQSYFNFSLKLADMTVAVASYKNPFNQINNFGFFLTSSSSGLPMNVDNTWKCTQTFQDNWFSNSFDDSSWPNAVTFQYFPNCISCYDCDSKPILAVYCRKNLEVSAMVSTEKNTFKLGHKTRYSNH
ncbi:hypothetical protein HELRODRAFT_175335 [Helobdella robusta]|uniref:Apple domain-containing protein n=1 Tax=Helobdella robusta TaxID=6412 RepID=T1F957_HELRO|nr:hypothetical protein HELRODRAFT_175335 [Helobdella robusta]ESO00842.1 hypothetical protein HELRODRAFT_175335 [Helobdella robusta]